MMVCTLPASHWQCCPSCGHAAACTEENIVLDKQAAIMLLTIARDTLAYLELPLASDSK